MQDLEYYGLSLGFRMFFLGKITKYLLKLYLFLPTLLSYTMFGLFLIIRVLLLQRWIGDLNNTAYRTGHSIRSSKIYTYILYVFLIFVFMDSDEVVPLGKCFHLRIKTTFRRYFEEVLSDVQVHRVEFVRSFLC